VPDDEAEHHEAMAIPGTELTAALKTASALRRLVRRPPSASVLRLRATRRDEIRAKLGDRPEVVIVNHKKWNCYPKLDNRLWRRGASDWYKAEVKGLHDRGFESYAAIEHAVVRGGKAIRVDEATSGARKVVLVERLAYERIVWIDWTPDPAYAAPRFYVEYDWGHKPHAEIALYEEGGSGYMHEMDGIKYRLRRGGPIKRLRRSLWSVGNRMRVRRLMHGARDERYRNR
jgi:hypothetical protein